MLVHAKTSPAAVRAPAVVASVDNLKVHFRTKRGAVHAVDGLTFAIRDGETLGLVGETGCGKTVTGRSFLRLVQMPPGIFAAGSIMFRPHAKCRDCEGTGCGHCGDTGRAPSRCPSCQGAGCRACAGAGVETVDLLTIPDERMRALRGDRIAMIFQDPGKALNPALTIGDQISEVFLQHRSDDLLEAAGIGPAKSGLPTYLLRRFASQRARSAEHVALAIPPLRARRNRIVRALNDMVAAALAETQIPNPRKVMERYPHELSGGMRQRVMIAQALACNPDLLIADEPTTALDVTVQARILELIADLQQRRQTSVLYISHDLSLVRRICDRVAVMYAGRIVEIGATDRIFRDPKHPYTRGLLAAVPSLASARGRLAAIRGNVPELIDPPPSCRFVGRCRYETDVCRAYDPTLAPVADEHEAACFIHEAPPSPAGVRPSFATRTE